MSTQNKYKPLTPIQRVKEHFSIRVYGPSPPPKISSPRPYNGPMSSPKKTTTGFRKAHKNGPRSDGEILWALIMERRADKKAKPSKIPRPKNVKGEFPLTPLQFADQRDDGLPRDEKLLEPQQGKRASKIPLPARLNLEPQVPAAKQKAAAAVPSTSMFGFKSHSKAAATKPTVSKSPSTPSAAKTTATKQEARLDLRETSYNRTPPLDPLETPYANFPTSGSVEYERNGQMHKPMFSDFVGSSSLGSTDSPTSSKKSKTKEAKPARMTRIADFLKPGASRRRKSSGASTDSDESFQCIGIPPDTPPKDRPPVPQKDARYTKPPRLPLPVSTYGEIKSSKGEYTTQRLPLPVSTYGEIKYPSGETGMVGRSKHEMSPYHVPSNPFAGGECEMGYERWLNTQNLTKDNDEALKSAGTFRLTQGSWGETLLPARSPSSSPTNDTYPTLQPTRYSPRISNSDNSNNNKVSPLGPSDAFYNYNSSRSYSDRIVSPLSPPTETRRDEIRRKYDIGKTNDELREEARERRKGIETLEKRARARRERSLVRKREREGSEKRRSSFYGFYDTLLAKDTKERR